MVSAFATGLPREASNRRMLPPKYAALSVDDLQKRLDQLRVVCAGRR